MIHRYPVKSMRGEVLEKAWLGEYGITGDRRYALRDLSLDRSFTARTAPELLNFTPSYLPSPEIDHRTEIRIESPEGQVFFSYDADIDQQFSQRFNRPLRFLHYPGGKFDDRPLHLIFMSDIQRLADHVHSEISYLRFRPNFLVHMEPVESFSGEEWIGQRIQIGEEAVIEIQDQCSRCVIPTINPVSLEKNPAILRTVVEKNQGRFGFYATTLKNGWVRPEDPLFIL